MLFFLKIVNLIIIFIFKIVIIRFDISLFDNIHFGGGGGGGGTTLIFGGGGGGA